MLNRRHFSSGSIAGEGKEGMPYDIPFMEIAVEKLKKKEAEVCFALPPHSKRESCVKGDAARGKL